MTVNWINEQLQYADSQYQTMVRNVPDSVMPESIVDGKLKTCHSNSWVAGFYPGALVYLFEGTGDSALYNEAVKKIQLMNDQQTSHPYYWAGFAIIGDGAQPLLHGLPTTTAAAPATGVSTGRAAR